MEKKDQPYSDRPFVEAAHCKVNVLGMYCLESFKSKSTSFILPGNSRHYQVAGRFVLGCDSAKNKSDVSRTRQEKALPTE